MALVMVAVMVMLMVVVGVGMMMLVGSCTTSITAPITQDPVPTGRLQPIPKHAPHCCNPRCIIATALFCLSMHLDSSLDTRSTAPASRSRQTKQTQRTTRLTRVVAQLKPKKYLDFSLICHHLLILHQK